MVSTVAYRLVYDYRVPNAVASRLGESIIHSSAAMLEALVAFEPAIETQNRKPLTRPPTPDATQLGIEVREAEFFRVFYRVHEARKEVPFWR